MSNKLKAHGSTLHVSGTGGAAKTITGATPGFPTIVTATAHGLSNGDSVTIASIAGTMATLMNVAGLIIRNVTANTFAVDVNTVGLTYTSGGTATALAWIKIGNLTSIETSGVSNDELDSTDLDSSAKDSDPGLPDYGSVSMNNYTNDDDTGQAALLAMQAAKVIKTFKITYPTGATPVRTFTGYVKKASDIGAIGVGKFLTGSVEIRRTSAVTIS